MSRAAADAELLRQIAAAESFTATVAAHPALSVDAVRAQLNALADELEVRGGKKPPLTLSEVEGTRKPPKSRPPDLAPLTAGSLHSARIYSDGAARGNPGPAGAGAVLMSLEGEILERLGKYLGKQTNNVAEYQGVLIGLRRAQALGVRDVEVYADSQLMIRQLGGIYKVKNEGLKPLHAEAVAMLRTFAKVKLVHVPREMNKDADEMSNRAIDERM